jgi:hypothetical protein
MNPGLRYLRPMAGMASIALFFCMLQRTGTEAVLRNIRVLGWGVVALILLSGLSVTAGAIIPKVPGENSPAPARWCIPA